MEVFLIIGGFLGFVAMWYIICAVIRAMAGFHTSAALAAQAHAGQQASRWSSMRSGLVRLNNCIKVVRVDEGFVVRLLWIFGGGYLAIPDADIHQVERKTFLLWSRVCVSTSGRNYTFFGSAGAVVWNWWQRERAVDAT